MKMWPAPEAIDRQAASKSQAKGSLLSCQSYQIYWSSIISIIQHSRHGYLDNKLITTHTVFSSWPCSTHLLGLFSACIPLTCMETYGNSMKLQCTAVVRLWVSKAESRTRSLPWILMPAVGWRSPEQNLVTLVACCEVGGSPVAYKILPLNMLTANTVILPSTWRRLNCRLGVVFRSMQGLDQLNLDAVQTANGQNSIPEARIIKDSNRVNRSR